MYKLLIGGSRDITDYFYFKKRIDKLIAKWGKENILIIEGGARGVDRMARQYAIDNKIEYQTFLADWEKDGKKAGMVRNERMLEAATHAVFFWDGVSVGTKHAINLAEEFNVPAIVFKVKKNDNGSTKTNNQPTQKQTQ